jgi:hypothetical protein
LLVALLETWKQGVDLVAVLVDGLAEFAPAEIMSGRELRMLIMYATN